MINNIKWLRGLKKSHHTHYYTHDIRKLNPNFSLSNPDSVGYREIIWKKKIVGQVRLPKVFQNHYAQPILIIASGSSVNETDISLLQGQLIFGSWSYSKIY